MTFRTPFSEEVQNFLNRRAHLNRASRGLKMVAFLLLVAAVYIQKENIIKLAALLGL